MSHSASVTATTVTSPASSASRVSWLNQAATHQVQGDQAGRKPAGEHPRGPGLGPACPARAGFRADGPPVPRIGGAPSAPARRPSWPGRGDHRERCHGASSGTSETRARARTPATGLAVASAGHRGGDVSSVATGAAARIRPLAPLTFSARNADVVSAFQLTLSVRSTVMFGKMVYVSLFASVSADYRHVWLL